MRALLPCFRFLPFLLAMFAAGGTPLPAQDFEKLLHRKHVAREGKPGVVLVKITAERFHTPVTPAMFGEAASRYGIGEVRPWIPPALLRYNQPVFKITAQSPRLQGLQRIMEVRYSALDAPDEVAAALGLVPGVEYAEPLLARRPLYAVNDQFTDRQWYLDSIKARAAWDDTRADSTIIIAIVDTGIDSSHEDLKKALWLNWDENGTGPNGDRRSDGIDNDDNGIVDDWWGYDFSGEDGNHPDNNPFASGDEHGVEVAGIAAATGDNVAGIAGVAFGARLMAVKVSDDRPFPSTKIYAGPLGVLYAAQMKATIINCSWGGDVPSRAEEEVFGYVIHDLRKVVVAAVGNDNVTSYFYPASYPGVISVAALTDGNARASFSNYNDRVDVSAPGTDLYTVSKFGYRYDSGTSFAAPVVSGIAALVAKKYPNLDGEQVSEVVRATTDDIGIWLGSAFADLMGTGRVNAQRALSVGPAIASARMTNYTLQESLPDGALDRNETVQLRANIRNLLAEASQVNATLSVVEPAGITITGANVQLGPMASGAEKVNDEGTFSFTIPGTIASNSTIKLKIVVETQDRASVQFITFRAAPTYLTTDYNRIAVTFNSMGNIAYDGLDQDAGDGFVYAYNETTLFHGGVMIGTGESRFADVVRVGRLSQGTAEGFTTTQPYRLAITPDGKAEIGTAKFTDVTGSLGIEVAMRTYEYRDSTAENMVLVVYAIRNAGATALDGLRCGLYLDWDVSSDTFNDRVDYDPANLLAFQRDVSPSSMKPYMGATLASPGSMNFYAVKNFDDSVNTNFSSARKWMMMSSGIHENTTTDDMSMVVSSEAFSIPAGETREVAFALLAAPTFDSLRATARRARALFQPSSVPAPEVSAMNASVIPNPVTDLAALHLYLPRTSDVNVTIYNVRGETVLTADAGKLEAGYHTVPLNMAALPDGIYLYELRRADGVLHGRFVKTAR